MEVPSGAGGGGANAVPPLVTFQWGEMIPFKAACTSLTVAFQLFKPNGTPIRADVKLALTQAETATSASANSANKKANPTTRSAGGLGIARRPRRRHAPVDRPPDLRRPGPLAHGRRGERDRQPPAPAARHAAQPPAAGLMPATRARRVRDGDGQRRSALDPELMDRVEKIEVRNFRGLPDMATVRMADPEGKTIANPPFFIGDKLEIRLGQIDDAEPGAGVRRRDRHATSRSSRTRRRRSACAPTTRRTDAPQPAQRDLPGHDGRGHRQEGRRRERAARPARSRHPDRAQVRPAEHGDRPGLPQPPGRGGELRGRRGRRARSSCSRRSKGRRRSRRSNWRENVGRSSRA